MKWGVRRYQNKDGSLTSAGKKRYQNPDGTLNEKGKKRLDNKSYEDSRKREDKEFEEFVKELNNPSPRSKMEIAEHDGKFDQEFLDKVKGEDWVSDDKRDASINQKMLSEYKKYLDNPDGYKKNSGEKLTMDNADLLKSTSPSGMSDREKSAADLGLKALKKMGRDPGEIDDNNREWFLYEDQTIGLSTVADLCAQGKSKAQIKALAKEASEAPTEKMYDTGYFELADLSGSKYLDQYIDACQAVIKEEKGRSKSLSTKDLLSPEVSSRNIGYAMKDATNPDAWKQGMDAYKKFLENPDSGFEIPEYLKKYYKR